MHEKKLFATESGNSTRASAKVRDKGQIDGEIRMVRTLQGLLGVAVAEEQELHKLTLEQLRAMTSELQEKLRNR